MYGHDQIGELVQGDETAKNPYRFSRCESLFPLLGVRQRTVHASLAEECLREAEVGREQLEDVRDLAVGAG